MKSQIFLTSQTAPVFAQIMESLGNQPMQMAVITTALAVEPETEPAWFMADKKIFKSHRNLTVFDYSITDKSLPDIEKDLADIDILYVTGGNVFYLLEQSQKSGFSGFVKSHVAAGKPYIGQSAGAIIAGPNIGPAYRSDKASKVEGLVDHKGFGIVDVVVLPHWGSNYLRDVYFGERFEYVYNEEFKYLPLTDYQYATYSTAGIVVHDVRPQNV